jgi:type IV pilus assembly protein PilY1
MSNHSIRSPFRSRRVRAGLLLVAALAFLWPATAGLADDTILFSTYVQPNVLLILDSSGSMNNLVWHPAYDPTVTPTCTAFSNSSNYYYTSTQSNRTYCSNTRHIYVDPAVSPAESTRYTGQYLNWLFSDAADGAWAEIQLTNNGIASLCTGGSNYSLYRRTRITAAKRALTEIVCEINQLTAVKFGLGIFRNATQGDPNGGFVIEAIDEYDATHAANLDSALNSVVANSWTPLGESLFQAYTYFMSRDSSDRPFGKDGTTRFPGYVYSTSMAGVGGQPGAAPPDPVEYACQKNFVIVLTDGEPTMDDFDANNPTDTAVGFGSIFEDDLIGDYNNDGETEENRDIVCSNCWSGFYLDDIALFMRTNDFRPDLDGDQFIDTYTVGFTTGTLANNLLQKTADVGNGIFFFANDAETLAESIVDAFSDIVAKAQSFTAATVPATRTAAGDSLYVTQFVPSENSPWWQGHLRAFEITSAGEIHDATGACALQDPNAPAECYTGPFIPGAPAFWDAGDEIPAPAARELYTSRVAAGVPQRVNFDKATMDAATLGVTYPPSASYPNSTALNAEGLTDEIVENVRGCELGTGVTDGSLVGTPAACFERAWRLGDIFHSNPLVVGSPSFFLSEPSYAAFSAIYNQRDQVIYAGTNDGFLRGFHAGDWDAGLNPPGHDRGTGTELFGFMPWAGRQNIRHVPVDTNGRDYYMVDGSPAAADVWMYSSPTQATKAADGSEWKTVVVSGMRQGGSTWAALDITDPTAASYPGYLWEFPPENAAAALLGYVGESWSDPVITKIRVKVGTDDNGGVGYERWVMIVTGGYDESGDPNIPATYNPAGTEGRAIMIVDMKTGELLAAKYYDPAAVAGDPQRDMLYAMPSTPGVYDIDFDGYADVIYVGDLGGQVFKWVIHPIAEDRVNDGSGVLTQPGWTFRKFFTAPTYQAVAGDPVHYNSFFFPPAATLRNGVLWLALGSGERQNLVLEGIAGDAGDNNRFYAFNDGDVYETSIPAQTLPLDESNLLDVSNTNTCSDVAAYRGYYLVGADGEKWVTNVDVFLYYVFAASFIPSNTGDPCDVGGESFLYVFRIYCGEGFFDDGSGNPERSIALGEGMPTDPRITVGTEGDTSHRVIINQQGGDIISLQAPPGFQGSGMFYWRELFE